MRLLGLMEIYTLPCAIPGFTWKNLLDSIFESVCSYCPLKIMTFEQHLNSGLSDSGKDVESHRSSNTDTLGW